MLQAIKDFFVAKKPARYIISEKITEEGNRHFRVSLGKGHPQRGYMGLIPPNGIQYRLVYTKYANMQQAENAIADFERATYNLNFHRVVKEIF